MLKSVVFLLFFLPMLLGFQSSVGTEDFSCPNISNLQITGLTGNSISFSWDGSLQAVSYKMWYTREEDRYTSGYFYTNQYAYNFTNLATGTYSFYFVAVCDGDESSVVIEDLIQI